MTVIKCKMCGGDIQITDQTYGTCDSCGSTMTLPNISDERKANLFNRANHFRRQNDFDKAAIAYESILNDGSNDAEAYWGLVLSRFGIEYVEDPTTHRRVPTCHRVQTGSILTDADYLAALEYAPDGYSRSLYEQEAKEISNIQKGILAVSSSVEPFDVFICYKETTDGGQRTIDSTLAQDLYYALEKEGYKVFFSRITLESKLGTQYEPYIFAALNSAKVMVVLGTKAEYMSSVWVKNEWSRYLALMNKDKSRLLIPCYRDMDAYDLPEQLSIYQSQDMGKIGFMQDLVHGIKKIVSGSAETYSKTSSTMAASSASTVPGVESLLKRGNLFLEDRDWKQADEYFDRVLDIDPECTAGYVGKLCAKLQIISEKLLPEQEKPIGNDPDFQKAMRFADESYRKILEGYHLSIMERLENERLMKSYSSAKAEIEHLGARIKTAAESPEQLEQISIRFAELGTLFDSIRHYKDSEFLRDTCSSMRDLVVSERVKAINRLAEEKREHEKNNAAIDQQIKNLREQQKNLLLKKERLSFFQTAQKNKIDRDYMKISVMIDELKKKYHGTPSLL